MHEPSSCEELLLAKTPGSRAKTPDEAIAGRRGFTLFEAGLLAPCLPPVERRPAPQIAPPPSHPCACQKKAERKPLTDGDRILQRYLCQPTAPPDGGVISVGGAAAPAHGDVTWAFSSNINAVQNTLLAKFQPKKSIWIYRFDVLLQVAGNGATFALKKDGQTIATVTLGAGVTSGGTAIQGGQVEVPATSVLTVEITSVVDRAKPGTTATMIARVAS